ncbi:MAG TPA: hypothetical protein VMR18_02725 [Candidatus Saccharimonadales bacterium]|nr:hypothetical protein [Candidatus Saccharimonadales bacterium]
MPADRITDVIAAYRAGSSLDKIGSELGVATGTVAAALRKAGEKIRPAVRFKLKAREEPKPRQQAERVAP